LLSNDDYAKYSADNGKRQQMATGNKLIFSGRAWPGVRIDGPTWMLGTVCQFNYIILGNGREWHTDQPRGFWRSFAGLLNTTDPEESRRFMARHGDPVGGAEIRKSGSNAEWFALQNALAAIAQAWDDPNDPNGVSHITDDRARLTTAQDALYELARPDKNGLPDMECIALGRGLVSRAKTLPTFMIGSAGHALEHSIPMQRCHYCNDWFEPRRTDALYCTASCQAAGYKLKAAFDKLKGPAPEAPTLKTIFDPLKGSTRGKHAQAHPPRPNHLPRRVARKRPGRKVSPKK
jgi:hypothetical protein